MGDRLEKTERCFFFSSPHISTALEMRKCSSFPGIVNMVEVCAVLLTA